MAPHTSSQGSGMTLWVERLLVILSVVFFPTDTKTLLNSHSPCWDFLFQLSLLIRHSWHFYSASSSTPVALPYCSLFISIVALFSIVNESIHAISSGAVKYLITGQRGACSLRKLDAQNGITR